MNKDSLAQLPTLSYRIIRGGLRTFLLHQYRIISIAIVAVGLLMAFILITVFFLKTPSPAELSTSVSDRSLNTSSIDELELWIEERQNAYISGVDLTIGDYFMQTPVTP